MLGTKTIITIVRQLSAKTYLVKSLSGKEFIARRNEIY
jgi:hypothetical protein